MTVCTSKHIGKNVQDGSGRLVRRKDVGTCVQIEEKYRKEKPKTSVACNCYVKKTAGGSQDGLVSGSYFGASVKIGLPHRIHS